MNGLIVAAHATIIFVHQRDHQRGARRTPCIGERQIRLGVDCFSELIAEMQRVGHGLGMFNFAPHANNASLATAFKRITTDLQQHIRQQLTQDRSMLLNFRAQVFHPTSTKPRIFHNRNRAHQFGGYLHGLAALFKGGLHKC